MSEELPSPVEMVRLNLTDLDPENYLLTDGQIQGLLLSHNGNVNRASAQGLRIIAVSEVLLSKAIRSQDLSTNGPAVARELRESAARLDAAANAADDAEDAGLILYNFGARQRRKETEEFRW